MEAIILAGGLGTRLSSLVPGLPKPMAPVGGKPFLEILLELLCSKGFKSAILSVGHMHDKIVAHFGTEFNGMSIKYEIEKTLLGTGGAIKKAMKNCTNDHVYIFNGDTFIDFNIDGVEKDWRERQSPIIIGWQVDNVSRYGALLIDGRRIIGLSEKGLTGSGIINAGCYVLPVKIALELPNLDIFSFEKDFLSQNLEVNEYYLYLAEGGFIDIGVPEDYVKAQKKLICRTNRDNV